MTWVDWLALFLVAGACGAVGQAITGYSTGGCLATIAVGFIGALFGLWLARSLNLPEPFALQIGNKSFPIIWSIVGSALFVGVLSFFTGRRVYL